MKEYERNGVWGEHNGVGDGKGGVQNELNVWEVMVVKMYVRSNSIVCAKEGAHERGEEWCRGREKDGGRIESGEVVTVPCRPSQEMEASSCGRRQSMPQNGTFILWFPFAVIRMKPLKLPFQEGNSTSIFIKQYKYTLLFSSFEANLRKNLVTCSSIFMKSWNYFVLCTF